MPTHTVWIDPELLLEHQGVRIFHVYKQDDYEQGTRRYSFTLDPQCGEEESRCEEQPCQHVFDARELATWQPPAQPPFCLGANDTPENHAAWDRYWGLEDAAIRAAIIASIECRELTPRGRAEVGEAKHRETPQNSDSPGISTLPTEPRITGKDLNQR